MIYSSMAEIILLIMTGTAIGALVAEYTDKAFGTEYIYVNIAVTASMTLALMAFSDSYISLVQGFVLLQLLIFASNSDIATRKVPDSVSVMIIIASFIGFSPEHLPSMLLGAVVVLIPQLAVAMIRTKNTMSGQSFVIGGADIKISVASAFLLGMEKGVLALTIGLSAAVTVMLISRIVKKTVKPEPFPLVPFLSLGVMAVFLL